MRIGGTQFCHRCFRGLAARDHVADHMIGFDRRACLDVAKHRRGRLRAFGGEHAAHPLEERTARRMTFGGRDRTAFIEHAENKILAAGCGQNGADRAAHQAGRGRERRQEHPLFPHLRHDTFAGGGAELAARHHLRDGAGPNDLIASSRSKALQLSNTTSNFSLSLSACTVGGFFSVTSPLGLLMTRPASASSLARLGRTRKVTSRPASSSLPPKYPPIAPAPTTRMCIARLPLYYWGANGEWRIERIHSLLAIRYLHVLLPLFVVASCARRARSEDSLASRASSTNLRSVTEAPPRC